MATESLDCCGMNSPKPLLKIAMLSRKLPPGTLLEVSSDCSKFPNNVQKWCDQQGKVLVACNDLGRGKLKAQIQL